MPTSREIRYRVVYVTVGLILLAVSLTAASVTAGWWWAIPGVLTAGWWWTGIEASVSRALGHDTVGDEFRSRPHDL